MDSFFLLLLLLIVLCVGNVQSRVSRNDKLLSVIAIFRNGIRTTTDVYPNDPYKNISYWPGGFGQITSSGIKQQYELGQWLRKRYDSFLPDEYSLYDIHVQSIDDDLALMSAESCLAGLYPPKGDQIWNENLNWQPIPVHTKEKSEDLVLTQGKPCLKYDLLLKATLKTDYFHSIDVANEQMYRELSEYTGMKIESTEELLLLYMTLYSEDHFGYKLPEWASKYYPGVLKGSAVIPFVSRAYAPPLARFRTGPLYHEILTHFKNITHHIGNTYQKFKMYSGHDHLIVDVLNTLTMYTPHWPAPSSTVLFELKQYANKKNGDKDEFYVDVFYKQKEKFRASKILKCDDLHCPLSQFIKVLEPVILDPKDWDFACNTPF